LCFLLMRLADQISNKRISMNNNDIGGAPAPRKQTGKDVIMKKQLCITLFALLCMTASVGVAQAVDLLAPSAPKFTTAMVSGKTMVSSGYDKGSMTFHSNGRLTCTNYPGFVKCKSWEVQPDGVLRREFTDSHTGVTVEVKAYWQLLSRSGTTLQVNQTSSNSSGPTTVTVTIQ